MRHRMFVLVLEVQQGFCELITTASAVDTILREAPSNGSSVFRSGFRSSYEQRLLERKYRKPVSCSRLQYHLEAGQKLSMQGLMLLPARYMGGRGTSSTIQFSAHALD
ncbi:hypothetical protein F2Q69_00021556 [Brassica cretica]|uniref:Uncharacterized protein n=1 Tax=Brassica cretica TaxID=69181 RepID=A0A8S9QCZ8_BRACR|nr:hypothetical protein F2Q69_00021556 [Brassica cretica]